MTIFLRVLDSSVDDKPRALLQAVAAASSSGCAVGNSRTVFEMPPEGFAVVPGSPFAYWVSDAVRTVFTRNSRFESPTTGRAARQGGVTGDDFRWFRLWTEVSVAAFASDARPRCASLAKGGRYSRHYCSVPLVVRWDDDRDTFWSFTGLPHRPSLQPASAGFYFRPGLTWPLRTNGLSFRVMPAGCVFGHKGPAAFVNSDSADELLALCAIVNCQIFGYLVGVQLARTELAQSFEVGLIQQTPVPCLSPEATSALARLARRAWSLKRSVDMSNETSHAFLLPPGLNEMITALDEATVDRELAEIQAQIDDMAFSLYGISAEERVSIAMPAKRVASSDTEENEPTDEGEDAEDEAIPSGGSEARGSWLVGIAFGRFDPRLATGGRPIPREPEPFDALPSRSAGMYPEGEEPTDRRGILVDDEGHADDLAAYTLAVAERIRVDVPENLRGWLAKEFFPLHIKMYSKSRRKAPIYWQLATSSASYSVWLYIHAFSKDTLFCVQNDYAAPKLAHEERRLESLTSELREGTTAAQRKQLAAQAAVVEELRTFLDEVKRVAPLWKPDLDDGVIINFAPLWRLVPQNKAWQKELKANWDSLSEGKYDWAHLAMHLWPERVVPACATDRSLAIAHSLEEVFWEEGEDGKWKSKKLGKDVVDRLIAERTSTSVKAALKSLLEAPAPGTRRGGGRRSASPRRPVATPKEQHKAAPPWTNVSGDAVVERVRDAIANSADGASKADVLAATGIADTQWSAAITALLDQGLVTKTGERRGARYHVFKSGGRS
ncbi:MAG: type II restriction endonuclease subunit M [Anaerolineae bacterium]